MLITTYGEGKFKIALSLKEQSMLKDISKWMQTENTKILQLMFRFALAWFLRTIR